LISATKLVKGVAWAAILIWTLVPFAYSIVVSFCNEEGLPDSLFKPPAYGFTLENWQKVLFGSPLLQHLTNSLYVAGLSALITVLACSPIAYSVSRYRSPLSSGVFYLFVFLRCIPTIVIVVPLFIVFSNLGLLNNLNGLTLAHLALTIPFAGWLLKGFFDLVPIEIEEACVVDGIPRLRVIFSVVVPLAASGIVVTATFAFLWSYIDLIVASMITRAETATLPIYLMSFLAIHHTYWAELAASSLLSIVPMLVVFAILQKYMVRGLTLGYAK
jgi:ABC-type glycerol-3-phosphate transport system permease component